MSYESNMLVMLAMPSRQAVKEAIITTLFKHNGSIKEFSASEDIVAEITALFSLNKEQRNAVLERIYRKENRIVKTPLWHRLLYRAANELANEQFVMRPTDTMLLTNRKEWLLTEKGMDYALQLISIPSIKKKIFPINTFEVQKEINKIKTLPRPEKYIPFEQKNKVTIKVRTTNIRLRSFRQAVIEAYDYTCCVCGLKLNSPDNLYWEVEAAHIVPHGLNGKDDIWNGVALCHLHHWAFDVGWFTFSNNYKIIVSSEHENIPDAFGRIGNFNIFECALTLNRAISLPKDETFHPHENAISWHRDHIFHP